MKSALRADLRPSLTPFGRALDAALSAVREEGDPIFRVIAATEACEPMRAILRRIGLQDKKCIGYPDGVAGPSWVDQPELFIRLWVQGDSAIVMKEDRDGPTELRFLIRLASDVVRIVYKIGDDPAGQLVFLRALWDLGITRWTAEMHVDRTPQSYIDKVLARYEGLKACALVHDLQSDGFIQQTLTMEERP